MRFTEEDAVALDRWIADVCGEEVQFPAHRQAQFSAYKRHLEMIRAAGGQSLFRHSSRSGTRETLALQNMLAALHQLCNYDLGKVESVRKEIGLVERMLHEKEVPGEGRSAAAASPETAVEGDTVSATGMSHDTCVNSRKLAESYVAEIERQRQLNRASMASCRARHLKLLDQHNQLQEELNALRETEEFVMSMLNETTAAVISERDAMAREQAVWEQRKQQLSNTNAAEHEGGDVKCNAQGENTKTLVELRASLNSVALELAKTQAQLSNQDAAHAVRFRLARQRLKDWQDMVEHVRRTHDQLYARTRVISTVVETNAAGLAADSRLSYVEQLRKLNRLLLERSVKLLGLKRGGEEEVSGVVGSAGGGGGGVLRELFTPSQRAASCASVMEAESSLSTSQHRSSVSTASLTGTSTEASSPSALAGAGSSNAHQQALAKRRRHRHTYALLTDLRRWETALVKESAVLCGICEKGLSSTSAPSPSRSPNACIQQLRSLLLAA
ncbi:hypothetical protein TraAM80_03041 [Trypanosoma rangeli]|uniref:Uncharacterized protein n=1 Tax=Trypanosoma rangeli TaxID=5698 RepID=A0A3R7MU68_TRYRA|nr:uncharacterized protein TraAM80_03041 [Trypanosoma rangeli]RNF08186.1 hypothetical protein TraAM80_03041 [Trypanosoma rangeli]|eukprot:RNF08186.1 hypothetical protein TraAM80_03041 [Trypanosoma rangeli]